jgi:molybdopterin synthase sulfur carrier subunit
MEWRLFATLSEAAGEERVTLDIGDEATLREAFDALLEAHPALASELLDDEEALYDHVRLLVDGADPFAQAEGWETLVDSETELALFPPVSGG